ncbi:hypothetical protein POPTR_011G143050v4 [Populus trichocarpa]|uniref:Uncharacterized protein n=1 Tax=Populus trichocarpa TaxID=3694 RepID=A0ACC0SB00_POPTR|nr:hypothetical protein POPTR_011G143050v4 [Populus trichocarpa]
MHTDYVEWKEKRERRRKKMSHEPHYRSTVSTLPTTRKISP